MFSLVDVALLFCFCITGFYLQIFWGHFGRCCPHCYQKRPKDQLARQPSPQAQGTPWTHFCRERKQGFAWQGTSLPQKPSISQGNLEEKQHPFSSSLPLILLLLFCVTSFSGYLECILFWNRNIKLSVLYCQTCVSFRNSFWCLNSWD